MWQMVGVVALSLLAGPLAGPLSAAEATDATGRHVAVADKIAWVMRS